MSKITLQVQSDPKAQQLAVFCQYFAWSLLSLVILAAFINWGHDQNWNLTSVGSYQLFPLLGLLAFSIMWSHYVSGFVRQMLKLPRKTLQTYFSTTSYVVLTLLFLHPGVIIYQRFRDGYGLPPGSYESYVRPGLGWVTLLGTVCFFVFMSFELRRRFGKKSWWKYVLMANDAAMLAIVYHGLRIGSNLIQGWFKGLWFFYAAVLLVVIASKFFTDYYPAAAPDPKKV